MENSKNTKFKIKKLIYIFIIFMLLGLFLIFYKNTNSSETLEIYDNLQTNSSTSTKESIVVELPENKILHAKITSIGDIMCHNSQYLDAYSSIEKTYNFSYVFDDIKDYISNSDISIGNLETTFAGAEHGYSNYPKFNTPEQLATNLKDLGIDILSTANNHCMDTGFDGLASTLNYLDSAGISHVGTNRSLDEQNTILIKDINGIKIAFLSFTYGTNGISIPPDKSFAVNLIDKEFIKYQIDLAKSKYPDLICVSMHWGIEYQTKQNATQEDLANYLFKNGVDIILGSHPHVLQPMEKRSIVLESGEQKDCFVIYSFGNFMSAQNKENTKDSIILNIEINKESYTGKTTISNITYTPIYMYKNSNSNKKYKILDIEKSIFYYESGIDKSIGQTTYSSIKNIFQRDKNMYNGFETAKTF